MRSCFPPTWTSLCGGNVMEIQLPQLWQVCVGHCSQVSRLGFRVALSAGPHLRQSLFSCSRPVFFKNHQLSKSCHLVRKVFGSRDTSQGRWEWLVAFVWLPDFVARLVRQVQWISVALKKYGSCGFRTELGKRVVT